MLKQQRCFQLLFVSILLLPRLGFADDATTRGYVAANDAKCTVWAPSTLQTQDYIPRYAGPCEKGRAEGVGKLEWLYRYSSMNVKATWSGNFHNGIFVGDHPMKKSISPMGGDRYLVAWGEVEGAKLSIVATSKQDGPPDFCAVENLALEVPASTPQADDDVIKKLLTRAVETYSQTCPSPRRGMSVSAYNVPLTIGPNSQLPRPFADARFDPGPQPLAGYSNQPANEARQKARQEAAAQAAADAQKQFDTFSSRNHVEAWVTTDQLESNPFRYQGKVVGVIVRLQRMVTANSALVEGSAPEAYAQVLLHDITPEFPDRDKGVMMAVRVGKREPLPEENGGSYTAVSRVDSRTCERADCYEMLSWARGKNGVRWGEPYPPKN